MFFPRQALMKKFVALGTECTKYLKVAKASEGKFFRPVFCLSCMLLFAVCLTSPLLSFAELQMLKHQRMLALRR
jgi:hypothetical protein